jgi:hypothetical protein
VRVVRPHDAHVSDVQIALRDLQLGVPEQYLDLTDIEAADFNTRWDATAVVAHRARAVLRRTRRGADGGAGRDQGSRVERGHSYQSRQGTVSEPAAASAAGPMTLRPMASGFLLIKRAAEFVAPQIVVAQNWLEELKALREDRR